MDVEVIFYDGHCGMCHAAVKFVLARDPEGKAFRFSPLQGAYIRTVLSDAERAALPDSLVVKTAEGAVLTRSSAVAYILRRLGGFWRFVGATLSLVPAPIRDWGYDRVAAVRRRIFAPPQEICPLTPPEIRNRFLD
jgi:predicted DCC family thiol-disulfide oxidoreductase YuxK